MLSFPMLKNPFFALPALAVEPHHLEAFERDGFIFKKSRVYAWPYFLDAYVFQFKDVEEASRAFLSIIIIVGVKPGATVVEVKWGNRVLPYVVTNVGNVRIIPLSGKTEDLARIEGCPYPQIRRLLENFSGLAGGLDIDFYAEDADTARPPLPDKRNLINIYPWSYPPGYSRSKYVHHAFGWPIDTKDGSGVMTFSGTPGRGEFVGDGENDLVQMIGNNWYLLFCVADFYNNVSTIKILERVLSMTLLHYQKLQDGKRATNKGIRLNRQKFVEATKEWVNYLENNIAKAIQDKEKEIEDLRNTLAIKERGLFDLKQVKEAVVLKKSKEDLSGSLGSQWRRIRSNPRISGLSLAGDTINITTFPVDVSHNGEVRTLGRYCIGVHNTGEFYIYSLDRFHPEGVPHPHINEHGTPCFGNASSAIVNAFREHRYADAIDYLIIWLFDGYEENLALHKITEWPIKALPAEGDAPLIVWPVEEISTEGDAHE